MSPRESELEFRNPNFQLGTVQAAISTSILTFCFIGRYVIYDARNKTIFFII